MQFIAEGLHQEQPEAAGTGLLQAAGQGLEIGLAGIEGLTPIANHQLDTETVRYWADPQFKLDRVACHGVASVFDEVGQQLVEAQLQTVDLLIGNPQRRPAGPQPAGGSTKLLRIGINLQAESAGPGGNGHQA